MEARRSALEELERIEQAIADRVKYNPAILPDNLPLSSNSVLHGRRKRPYRETLTTAHEVTSFLDRFQTLCKNLKKSSDKDEVIEGLGEFDLKYAELRAHHRRYPNETVEDQAALYKKQGLVSAFAADLGVESKFSGEEFLGKFLDLLRFHEEFLNFKFTKERISYVQFLKRFMNFDDLELYPQARLRDEQYISYISRLHIYLQQFLYNTRPLSQPEKTIERIESTYEAPSAPKSEGLFCGPCGKLFTNENVFKIHFDGKKHKKNLTANDESPALADEHCIKGLTEFLAKVIDQTRDNVERRQVLTDKERQEEISRFEVETFGNGEVSEDDDNDSDHDKDDSEDAGLENTNRLNLPIGADGAPIPYWLWKLHGLDTEFNCEICGNFTYMGRKAFANHFMDSRHVQGLRALGIEPEVIYKDITDIKEALKLAERRKIQRRKVAAKEDGTVEMEDDEGNVMSKKVYEDLKKQGLI